MTGIKINHIEKQTKWIIIPLDNLILAMFVAKLIQQVFIHTKKLYFLKKNNSLI